MSLSNPFRHKSENSSKAKSFGIPPLSHVTCLVNALHMTGVQQCFMRRVMEVN